MKPQILILFIAAFLPLQLAADTEADPTASADRLLEAFESMPASKAKDAYIADIASEWASLMGNAMRRCSRLRDEDAHVLLRIDEDGVVAEVAGLTDNRVTQCLAKTYHGAQLAPPPFQPFVMSFRLEL